MEMIDELIENFVGLLEINIDHDNPSIKAIMLSKEYRDRLNEMNNSDFYSELDKLSNLLLQEKLDDKSITDSLNGLSELVNLSSTTLDAFSKLLL